eukprot:9220523-Prorocentrum_lima.AAC.1
MARDRLMGGNMISRCSVCATRLSTAQQRSWMRMAMTSSVPLLGVDLGQCSRNSSQETARRFE